MEIILLAADSSTDGAADSGGGGGLSTSIAICAAILFVSLWLMLRGRLLKSRGRSCCDTAGDTVGTVRQPSATDEVYMGHIAQTYETVREMTGRLDTKLRLLDAMIRDADRAAARLEAARRGEDPPVRPDRDAEECVEEIYLYADYGFSVSDIASRLGVPVESVERILRERG